MSMFLAECQTFHFHGEFRDISRNYRRNVSDAMGYIRDTELDNFMELGF
jgi:hypothetical protein